MEDQVPIFTSPKEQGGIGFTFHRLLRHSLLRLRHSNPSQPGEWGFTSSSNLTTDGQSARLSWYQATSWHPRPILSSLHGYYLQIFSVFVWFGAPSLTRGRVCNLLIQVLLSHTSAVTLGSKSRRNWDHILLSHLNRVPSLLPVNDSLG
jgi:hypothetical protein